MQVFLEVGEMIYEERERLLSAFSSGYSTDAYLLLGCHDEGDETHSFRVWAPDALAVSVVGDFNGWDASHGGMFHIGGGVWEGIHTGVSRFDCYKYRILSKDGKTLEKSDPFATHAATRPDMASKVFDIRGFPWTDSEYLAALKEKDHLSSPIHIYEVHAGSWRRGGNGEFLSYHTLADTLIPYLLEMHYTHVELLPVAEHPYDPSWGYQVTGYYAPSSRYGTPHDLMYFVNKCHESGIGVILDWVGAHFPKDNSGLAAFDGSFCYESPDDVMREHPDWGTHIFNYDRNEVRSFLTSNVCYWLKEYHIDGIRADAVASMLYLDYGRGGKEWHPNRFGGNHNLAAIDFLREMNRAAHKIKPEALMIAEESTAFPGVTRSPEEGGLGFDFKWNMGWMNDTLRYMKEDPLFRKYHHDTLTFPFVYAFDEKHLLPLSHDEVVHGKGSLINKMPGTYEEKFAGLRAFLGYMMFHPGKKLLFMGSEFGQFKEWDFENGLDWLLLDYESHRMMRHYTRTLNHVYLDTPALWEKDFTWEGFEWIANDDHAQSVLCFRRRDKQGREVVAVCNFTPVQRVDYRIGLPLYGDWVELFNSDLAEFGGTNTLNGRVAAEAVPCHGLPQSMRLTLPPLSVLLFSCKKEKPYPVETPKTDNKSKKQ